MFFPWPIHYLESIISDFDINQNLEENIKKICRLKVCITRYFGKSMRKEVQLKLINVKIWERNMGFEIRSSTKALSEINSWSNTKRQDQESRDQTTVGGRHIVTEIGTYQKKWRQYVQWMPTSRYPHSALLYRPT